MRERDRLSLLKQAPAKSSDEGEVEEKKKLKKKTQRREMRNSALGKRLLQAGIDMPIKAYVCSTLALSMGMSYLASLLGIFLAIFVFAALTHFMLFGFLEEKAAGRKKKVVPHLPPFIDSLASALGTGYNLEAAIVQATMSVPNGVLRTELDRVSNALNLGFSVRDATAFLRERIAGREITSLVVSLNLFSSMGGTVLEPFRRLAGKIRDQQMVTERANRDLVMVKQAFYIIFVMALGVPMLLLVAQPDYLTTAYNDTLGRLILQVGEMMVLIALITFKRMTNLKI